jgi:ElaB/YqjD/DUF883 family membrane-anchored ribosome-binding protein
MNDTHPLDSTRRMASEALQRASDTMRDLRSGMSERASAAQRTMGDYTSASTRYVAEHPLKSALVAAAVGAAVAGLVLAMRHRRELDDRWF